MKLPNSLGPNPRMVRMFAKEKGIDLGFQEVDLMRLGFILSPLVGGLLSQSTKGSPVLSRLCSLVKC